jgi:hypothetical protein
MSASRAASANLLREDARQSRRKAKEKAKGKSKKGDSLRAAQLELMH